MIHFIHNGYLNQSSGTSLSAVRMSSSSVSKRQFVDIPITAALLSSSVITIAVRKWGLAYKRHKQAFRPHCGQQHVIGSMKGTDSSSPRLNEIIENGQISSSSTCKTADKGHPASRSTAHMTDTKTDNMNHQSHQRSKWGSLFFLFCINPITNRYNHNLTFRSSWSCHHHHHCFFVFFCPRSK